MRRLPLAVLLAAAPAGCSDGSAPPPKPGPVVTVEFSYPGADAAVVDEVVVTPLVFQLFGAENVIRTEAESRADGTGQIVLRFAPGADPDVSQVVVQKRVAWAEPMLPEEARRVGLTVRKGDPGRPPAFDVVVRGGPGLDAEKVAVLADLGVKDSLARLVGVDDARSNRAEPAVRVWLDPDRLAARKLTAAAVARALAARGRRVTADPAGETTLTVAGDADTLEKVIVQTTAAGQVVYLRDVGRLEIGPAAGFARLSGQPVGVVAVYAGLLRPGEPSAATIREALGRMGPPEGGGFDLFADRTAAGPLTLAELTTAVAASAETADQAAKHVRVLLGKPCLAVSGPGPNTVTLLVPGAEPAAVRTALAAEKVWAVRVTDVSDGGEPFPVRLALTGPDADRLRAWAEATAKRAGEAATDVAVRPGPSRAGVGVTVDREKCQRLGVSAEDVSAAAAAHPGATADALRRVELKSAGGSAVRLGAVATFEARAVPPAVLRVDGERAVVLGGNPPAGRSAAAAAAAVRKVAEAERAALRLPDGYKPVDLTRP